MREITQIIKDYVNAKNIKLVKGKTIEFLYPNSKYCYAKKIIIINNTKCDIEIIDDIIKIEVL